VSIDDCDTALATKYGSQLGSEWACANTSVQVLESRYALYIDSISMLCCCGLLVWCLYEKLWGLWIVTVQSRKL